MYKHPFLFLKEVMICCWKPLAVNEEEMWQLVEAARKHNSKVMICHVLRYSPFYADIRRRILMEKSEI